MTIFTRDTIVNCIDIVYKGNRTGTRYTIKFHNYNYRWYHLDDNTWGSSIIFDYEYNMTSESPRKFQYNNKNKEQFALESNRIFI